MNRAGLYKKKLTIPNLLYCNNFFYYCQLTWQWAGGCLCKYVGRQQEQLRVHAGTGMGASRNAMLFGREPRIAREQVESAGADGGHGLIGACSKHDIGKSSAKSCDHLQQIYTQSFIYYGKKLQLHIWRVYKGFTQIPFKTTWEQ
jgi:hypothetical protein